MGGRICRHYDTAQLLTNNNTKQTSTCLLRHEPRLSHDQPGCTNAPPCINHMWIVGTFTPTQDVLPRASAVHCGYITHQNRTTIAHTSRLRPLNPPPSDTYIKTLPKTGAQRAGPLRDH